MRCVVIDAPRLVYSDGHSRCSPRLEFGTAGLRGPMRAGWAGLNDLMVVQTCQGVGRYASAAINDALARGVVIGYDHRHNSRRWAEMAAESFATQGFQGARVYHHDPHEASLEHKSCSSPAQRVLVHAAVRPFPAATLLNVDRTQRPVRRHTPAGRSVRSDAHCARSC